MLYEIVKSSVSYDGNVCYFLYRHKAEEENIICDTYGLSATTPSGSASFNDVITDSETALELLNAVSSKSVSVNGLENFITKYIDKM